MAIPTENRKYIDGYLINYSSSNKYPTIFLNGKNVLVHRYIWKKYNGEIPKGYQIHHKDKNRLNFDLSNLELIKISDHIRKHAIENSLGKSNKGKYKYYASGFCGASKSVLAYKDTYVLDFLSITQCAKFLNVKAGDICRILKGKRKSLKGWRFINGWE